MEVALDRNRTNHGFRVVSQALRATVTIGAYGNLALEERLNLGSRHGAVVEENGIGNNKARLER